jgi:hypothetical protein
MSSERWLRNGGYEISGLASVAWIKFLARQSLGRGRALYDIATIKRLAASTVTL